MIKYTTKLVVKEGQAGYGAYEALEPILGVVNVIGDDITQLRLPSRYLLFVSSKSDKVKLLYLEPISDTTELFEIRDQWQAYIKERFKPYPNLTVYPYNATKVRNILKTGKQSWTIQ